MNFTAFFLALMFGAATLFGQDASPPTVGNGVLLAQPPRRPKTPPSPRSTIMEQRIRRPRPHLWPPAIRRPSRRAPPVPGAAPASGVNPMTLWRLIQDGGWVMVVIGFLSVVTVMLVLTYIFTLRRGAILTPHYMNTADVLLKKPGITSACSPSPAGTAKPSPAWCSAPWILPRRTPPPRSRSSRKSPRRGRQPGRLAAASHGVIWRISGCSLPWWACWAPCSASLLRLTTWRTRRPPSPGTCCSRAASPRLLIATASGLILGITAMFFYSLFRNRVQSLISDLEIASAHILGLIALNFNKKREQSRVAVDEEF